MQSLKYIRYFFYLAYNWNFSIARHILKNEIRGEKEYGIQTTGADELKHLSKKDIDISHATIYMPASYDLLENIFAEVKINSIHHFIDIGCGKGRALCVAAHYGLKKITGIDFSKEFCIATQANLEKTKQKIPELKYTVLNNDAFYFDIPDDADCIFMFNPFDEVIMAAVINNINKSLKKNPRKITVIYLNPIQKHLFLKNNFVETFHTKNLHYLEGAVYIKNPR